MLRFAKIFSERLVLSNRLRVLSRQHNSFTKTKVDSSFVQEVRNIVGNENLSLSPSVLERHGRDEGYYPFVLSSPPDVVAWPSNIQHVVDIIKLCYHSNVPIIPFGTGTGMEGGIGALRV
ncbi:hypothetical protein B4U79_18571 [Dinothrombium tinctorium]|uniref:FAD linked oxidase N-terminal domain-containing protein n=1 Tax=Dinothrombium tinctorium TaxID=1965070 RepID=A0A3S3NF46_9ACAR|nr:hypothetical protein B4U79_18789 [Dinothrombium tinctorium]RWS01407.1 hypothetical protein B4U79_18571 [Dinothrombium tinctorium]